MLESFLEFLTELFGAGTDEAVKSEKTPKIVKCILLTIPFAFVEALFVFLAFQGKSPNIPSSATPLCIAFAVAFLGVYIYLLIVTLRKK